MVRKASPVGAMELRLREAGGCPVGVSRGSSGRGSWQLRGVFAGWEESMCAWRRNKGWGVVRRETRTRQGLASQGKEFGSYLKSNRKLWGMFQVVE